MYFRMGFGFIWLELLRNVCIKIDLNSSEEWCSEIVYRMAKANMDLQEMKFNPKVLSELFSYFYNLGHIFGPSLFPTSGFALII